MKIEYMDHLLGEFTNLYSSFMKYVTLQALDYQVRYSMEH